MEKDDAYYFHQTPHELALKLVETVPLKVGDIVYEPFRGEGAFFNSFPDFVEKKWTEITEGKDYRDFDNESYDWVITNPPFKLDGKKEKRENAFWLLLDYFTDKAKKGVAFLANDRCFCTLTPLRIKKLNDKGWYIQSINVCSVKKWRGRYFFIILTKSKNQFYSQIAGNF